MRDDTAHRRQVQGPGKDPAQAAWAKLFKVRVELDRIMTLDKAHETLTLIRRSVLTDFKAEDVVVISPSPCYCKKACSSSMGMSEEEKPRLEDYESKVYYIPLTDR